MGAAAAALAASIAVASATLTKQQLVKVLLGTAGIMLVLFLALQAVSYWKDHR